MSVYLLAALNVEFPHHENLPAAALYRITAPLLQRIDQVAQLIKDGVLSNDGAYVAVAATDVAWLRCVGFTSENTLASVHGFFSAQEDRVLYLCDAANMEIDGERADFRDACELYELRGRGDGSNSGLRLQSDQVRGIEVSAAGCSDGWALRGFPTSWAALREQILQVAPGLEQRPNSPRASEPPPIAAGEKYEFYAEMQQAELPEHMRMRNYTGQSVTVMSGPVEADDGEGSELFTVRAADGREFAAFEEELNGWNKLQGQYFWPDGTFGPEKSSRFLRNEKKVRVVADDEIYQLDNRPRPRM